MIGEVKVSVSKECAVSWVIVLFMKSNKVFVCEFSNMFGITAGVKLILSFRKQIFIDFMNKCIIWVWHCSFHFIIDYSFIFEATLRIILKFEFKSMTFLPEVVVVQVWKEGTICVNWKKVSKILCILARKWIHSKITSCPSIHISI